MSAENGDKHRGFSSAMTWI